RHTRSKRDWSSDVCSSDLFFKSPCGIENTLSSLPDLIILVSRAFPLVLLDWLISCFSTEAKSTATFFAAAPVSFTATSNPSSDRSEERRVGKECKDNRGNF